MYLKCISTLEYFVDMKRYSKKKRKKRRRNFGKKEKILNKLSLVKNTLVIDITLSTSKKKSILK